MKTIIHLRGATIERVEHLPEAREHFGDMTMTEIRQYDRACWSETPWPLWDADGNAYDLQLRSGHDPIRWSDCEWTLVSDLRAGDQIGILSGVEAISAIERIEPMTNLSDGRFALTVDSGSFELPANRRLPRYQTAAAQAA
jgi:hypothetical protein